MSSFTDSKFIQRLESLYLLARKVLGGSLQADRKSKRKGTGITFADYSEYQLGDDFRSIDWQVFAKSDELFIKFFEMEEDATVYIMLDCSHSMESKFLEARQLAAALGYIALNFHDRLVAYGMADKLQPLLEPSRGRWAILPFLKSLEKTKTFGNATNFNKCVKELQARHRKKGIVIIISDFLFSEGYADGLLSLQGMKHDNFCLQIYDAAAYKKAMQQWNEGLKKTCNKRNIGHLSTVSSDKFDETISKIIRKGGVTQ